MSASRSSPATTAREFGIGERRAVAEKFRQHVDVAGKQRRLPRVCRARDDALLEKLQNLHAGGLRGRDGFGIRRMRPDQMIDGRAGRRLAAFVEPEAGNHARIIRAPRRPGTKRGSVVVAMMQAEVPMM